MNFKLIFFILLVFSPCYRFKLIAYNSTEYQSIGNETEILERHKRFLLFLGGGISKVNNIINIT